MEFWEWGVFSQSAFLMHTLSHRSSSSFLTRLVRANSHRLLWHFVVDRGADDQYCLAIPHLDLPCLSLLPLLHLFGREHIWCSLTERSPTVAFIFRLSDLHGLLVLSSALLQSLWTGQLLLLWCLRDSLSVWMGRRFHDSRRRKRCDMS